MGYAGKHEKNQVAGQFNPPPPPGNRPWRRFWKILLILTLVLGAGGIVASAGLYWYFSRDLPSIQSLREYRPSLVTRIFGENQQLLGRYFIERRVVVSIDKIPEHLLQAIIAVEDSRFYQHMGVDPIGIIRALVANLGSLRIRQGASTITQQLARSLFLTSERSYARKFREALLALKMERLLTKSEILELYLNQIYFGHGTYGVQAAAKIYFDKDISELSLAEAAYMAGVPRAPTDYSPYNHPERAKQRQGVVLGRMKSEGIITEEKLREVYGEDLYFRPLEKTEKVAPYFMEYIRQYLSKRYGDTMVYKGGLTVYTTLNLDMQRVARTAVETELRRLDKRQGYRGPISVKTEEEIARDREAIVGAMALSEIEIGDRKEGIVTEVTEKGATVIVGGHAGWISLRDMDWARRRVTGPDLLKDFVENKKAGPEDILKVGDVILVQVKRRNKEKRTAVLALDQEPLVEGALLALDPRTGAIKAMVGGYDFKRSEFNRAVSARRQTGSTFKPFIYATAIDRGYSPASIVVDAPIVYTDSKTNRVWKPRNYASKFYGPVNLRDALTFSRNLATVRLLQEIKIRNVIDFSRRLGIKSPLPRDLSLALGSASLTLLEVTQAFGVFANEGIRAEPVAILSVVGQDGIILEEHESIAQEAISRDTAYIVTNMMEDVIQRGTGRRAKSIGRALAGKTGTTNDYTDAWFVGFSPNLAVGAWVGFDQVRSLGNRESGSRAALPIWISFMKEALEMIPTLNFKIPENIVYSKIDPKTGLLAPEGSEEGKVEIFVNGRQPVKTSRPMTHPADFFRIDAADGQVF